MTPALTAQAVRTAQAAVKQAVTGPGGFTRVAAAVMLAGTLASQHPNPSFGRISRLDLFSGAFPNWRFFAPNPAQHDFHFFYRTLNTAGETSEWRSVDVIAGRKPVQFFWFPGRRPEKAVFDVGTELITNLSKGFAVVTKMPAYRTLCAYLRAEIVRAGGQDAKGFQFTLARATGYDESEEPEVIFVSPYVPMRPGTPAAGPAAPVERAEPATAPQGAAA
ncbi:hypothetical protein PJ985_00535 [Streptomyces sp. ACA25]|uniref:hypothetical protein n=1 Tax=Streptomyces sp. ACA25 TaxID=3022596 RepID=UPI00230701A7|nr:hypothetical protein [Streptomyces sp. ACA25]MDB1086069.1 hypothetical protein [Streptomyces sp. ACA25]